MTVLHCTLYYTVLYYTVLNCTVLYCTLPHLYCSVLYCTAPVLCPGEVRHVRVSGAVHHAVSQQRAPPGLALHDHALDTGKYLGVH